MALRNADLPAVCPRANGAQIDALLGAGAGLGCDPVSTIAEGLPEEAVSEAMTSSSVLVENGVEGAVWVPSPGIGDFLTRIPAFRELDGRFQGEGAHSPL